MRALAVWLRGIPCLLVTLLTVASALASAASAAAVALPDERVVELVSTSGSAGAEAVGVGEPYTPASPFNFEQTGLVAATHPFEAAESGDTVTYVGEPPASGGTGETGPGEGNQWLAARTSDGWKTYAITPASNKVEFKTYQAFSPDLSTAFLEGGAQPLTSEVSQGCRSLYARSASGGLRALFTAGEAHGAAPFGVCGRPLFAGATEIGSQVIFQSEAALTSTAEEATETPPTRGGHTGAGQAAGEPCQFGCNLYVASAGHLRLVNEVEGKPVPSATFGGYPGGVATGVTNSTNFSNAIATDGSRIFWTDTQVGSDFEHVYVLENGTATVQVSGPDAAEYWTATPDGRYAFYTENGELWRFDTHSQTRATVTPAAYGATGTGNLIGPSTGKGTTVEGSNVVTGVVTSTGAFAVGQTIGGVPGEGCGNSCIPSGTTITAVGAGTLTLSANATASETEFGIAAGSNLVTSVAAVGGEFHIGDHVFGAGISTGTTIVGSTPTTLELSTVASAPGTGVALYAGGSEVQGVIGTNQTGGEEGDGTYIYLVADGVIAGNENANKETATKGQPNLYLLRKGVTTFIATLSPEDNQIRVASVSSQRGGDWKANLGERTAQVTPDGRHLVFESLQKLTGYENLVPGSRPSGEVFVFSAEDGSLTCASCNPSGAQPNVLENEVVTKLPVSSESNTSLRRWITPNGNRVFFDSQQPLTAGDTNGVLDVYEWEREGEGTCTAKEASTVTRGCVFLLSGGSSQDYSFLVDADATGRNVFLEHVGPLGQVSAPVDHNELYDVRIGGGFPTVSSGCGGEACLQAAPAPPEYTTPASTAFSGAGNFPPAPPVVKSVTRAQKLAKALKLCKADKSRRKRQSCERQARKKYGAVKAKKAKRTSNNGRARA